MHFALLGDHEDGLGMARALVASGRHHLATFSGPASGAARVRALGLDPRCVGDVEEVLADPKIEAVLVASRVANRPGLLRRALQSERHVLCAHPPDKTPDIAYEAALIQGDTRCVLLPLLPEALHPGIRRLEGLLRDPEGPIGSLGLLEMEMVSQEPVLLEADAEASHPHSLPCWSVIRALAGEIAEVSAFAAREEIDPREPLLLTGRFVRGGLFHATFLPKQSELRSRLTLAGKHGRAELEFPLGGPGRSRLTWRARNGTQHEETWEAWDPWPALVGAFESALEAAQAPPSVRTVNLRPTWQDAIRNLELDDAARRSVERRRVSTLEYPEATEEVGFKGTMTLVGCGLLWGSLLLLVLSHWVPWLGWLIGPLLVVFLGLQLLRWAVPRKKADP